LNEQAVSVTLSGKETSSNQQAILYGPIGGPYHVLDDKKNYAVVWGPFTEEKTIQVSLFWISKSIYHSYRINKEEIVVVRDSFTFFCQIIESASTAYP